MPRAVLIRRARQLLTLQGPPGSRRGPEMSLLGVIEDGSVLIVDGRVHRVGRTRQVENLAEARDAVEFDATGRVVLPAFIDCLADLSLTRSVEAGSRQSEVTAARVLRMAVRHGTARAGVRVATRGDEAADLRTFRRNAAMCEAGGPELVPTLGPFLGPLPEYVPGLRAKGALRFACAVAGTGGLDAEDTLNFVQRCRSFGIAPKVEVAARENPGCVAHLLAAGVFALEGLNLISPTEAEMMGRTNAIGVLAPGLVLSGQAEHYPPARTLIEAAVPLALASGFRHGVLGTLSMQTVIALAQVRMRMSVEECLCAATLNAAHALGIGDSAGSLEHGKDADILILDVPDYRELGRLFGVNVVSCMIKRGHLAYKDSDSHWPVI